MHQGIVNGTDGLKPVFCLPLHKQATINPPDCCRGKAGDKSDATAFGEIPDFGAEFAACGQRISIAATIDPDKVSAARRPDC